MIKKFEIIFLNFIILILVSGVTRQVEAKEKNSSNTPLTFSSNSYDFGSKKVDKKY